MALRHIALTASRRLLASSGAAGGGGSRHRAGGSGVGFTTGSIGNGSSSWVQSARFWSWGGSNGDDDAGKGKKEEDGGDGDASNVDERASVGDTHAGVDEAAAAPPSDDLGGGSGAAGEREESAAAAAAAAPPSASDGSSDGGFFSGADTGAREAPDMTSPSPWSVAMKESIMDGEASHQPDDRQEGSQTPEIASPAWNVPSEDGEERRMKEAEALVKRMKEEQALEEKRMKEEKARWEKQMKEEQAREEMRMKEEKALEDIRKREEEALERTRRRKEAVRRSAPALAPAGERKKFVPRALRKGAAASASRADEIPGSAPPAPTTPTNLYIKNLPRDFDATKLAHLFLPFGDVLTAKYVSDQGPVPTGVVRFAGEHGAAAATAALQGKKMGTEEGEPSKVHGLKIATAKSKAERDAMIKEREERQKALETQSKEKRTQFLELQERKKAEREQREEERKTVMAQVNAARAERAERERERREEERKKKAQASSVSIYVKHCPRGFDDAQMSAVFAPFGNIISVALFRSTGGAIIQLSRADARTAIASLQGVQLEGCQAPMELSVARAAVKADASKPAVKLSGVPDPEKVELAKEAARTVASELAKARNEERKRRVSELVGDPELARERARAFVPRAKRDQPGGGGGERAAAAVGADAADGGFYGSGRRRASLAGRGEAGAGGGGGGGDERKKYSDRGGKGAGAAAASAPAPETRERLVAAAEKMRARGKMSNVSEFTGKNRRVGGGGGRGRDRERGERKPRGFNDAMRLDPKTKALIEANVAEAHAMSADEEEWQWDPSLFQTHLALQLGDNINDAEMNAAPYLPGLSAPRTLQSDEEILMENKEWLMKFSDIGSDGEFENVKKSTLKCFETYKALEKRERLKRGESPIQSDFMAERQLLANEVANIAEENPLYEFAKKALATLDGNSGWSYDKKIKALRVLMKKSEKYQPEA